MRALVRPLEREREREITMLQFALVRRLASSVHSSIFFVFSLSRARQSTADDFSDVVIGHSRTRTYVADRRASDDANRDESMKAYTFVLKK